VNGIRSVVEIRIFSLWKYFTQSKPTGASTKKSPAKLNFLHCGTVATNCCKQVSALKTVEKTSTKSEKAVAPQAKLKPR